MAADGSVFDLPDTQENARVFGYPGSRRGTRAAFPKARLVFWVEASQGYFILKTRLSVSRPYLQYRSA
jgi:hypothetical protein